MKSYVSFSFYKYTSRAESHCFNSNSAYNCSANQIVVDSNDLKSLYVIELFDHVQ